MPQMSGKILLRKGAGASVNVTIVSSNDIAVFSVQTYMFGSFGLKSKHNPPASEEIKAPVLLESLTELLTTDLTSCRLFTRFSVIKSKC